MKSEIDLKRSERYISAGREETTIARYSGFIRCQHLNLQLFLPACVVVVGFVSVYVVIVCACVSFVFVLVYWAAFSTRYCS